MYSILVVYTGFVAGKLCLHCIDLQSSLRANLIQLFLIAWVKAVERSHVLRFIVVDSYMIVSLPQFLLFSRSSCSSSSMNTKLFQVLLLHIKWINFRFKVALSLDCSFFF